MNIMQNNNKRTSGLVLGKFMPLHRGHELLLRFAASFVDDLYVVVDHLENEWAPGSTRCKWVRQTVPGATVLYLDKIHPQDPNEHPDFWNIWKTSLISILPSKPDYVLASEQYGFKLAEVLGAQYIPVDLKRENIAINATRIRQDIYGNWDFLSDAAKPDFLTRVCIFGPESTGKTTLTKALAQHYETVWVPEYARLLIEAKGDVKKEDMIHIARGQLALEEAIAPKANKILFCDTDPLATTIWSKWLFQDCPKEISDLASRKSYDMYLLTDIDLPWEKDQVRYFPNQRKEFLASCREALEQSGRKYHLVCGIGNERAVSAINAISTTISEFFQGKKL